MRPGGFREQLGVAVFAEDVHGLSEVVVLVLIVADAAAADRNIRSAVLDPLLGQLGFVFAG